MRLFILFLACFRISGVIISKTQADEIVLHRADDIFNAVERALRFMIKHYYDMNLDGAMGTRILQGVYGQLIGAYGTWMPRGMLSRMRQLEELAELAGQLGTTTAAISTPYYFSKASFLLDPKLWQFLLPTQTFKELPPAHVSSIFEDDDLCEESSDRCLLELIPHSQNGGCDISKTCFSKMNSENLTSYSLTHQVIYYLVGIGTHCELKLADLAESSSPPRSLEESLEKFCSKIDAEARALEEYEFPAEARDLLMEQVGVCGVAGFTGIARDAWLTKILSWQNTRSGCFHRFRGENLDPMNFDPGSYGNFKRRRRSEKIMPEVENPLGAGEFCLSHRTGVALVALSAYTRRLVEEIILEM